MVFSKESPDHLKCNICSKVLKTDGTDEAPQQHIKELHKDVYELHKESLECSMGYQIEFLQFSMLGDKTQPVVIEEICGTTAKVIEDTLPKDTGEPQYVVLSTSKTDEACRKRSWVWKYFTKLSDKLFRCSLCAVVLSIKGFNSNNMNRHVRSRHPGVYRSEVQLKKDEGDKALDAAAPGKPLRSWVWSYFSRSSRTRATCRLCGKAITHGGNATGNLNRHLKMIHNRCDDENYWIWKVVDNEAEEHHTCKICGVQLQRDVGAVLDHLRLQHELLSADQIFTIDA